MNNTVNEYEIIINNQKIWSFYNEHKNVNIESANLLLIEFMETIFNNMTNDINSNINSQLLSFMNENKTQIDSIKTNLTVINENISKLNSDIANNMMIQFMNIKREYIEDVRQIVTNTALTTNEKLSSLIDKNSLHLMDKTSVILNEVIPKSQDKYNREIKDNFIQFHSLISDETSKLAKSFNNEKSLTDFISKFETKYQSMLQTVQQPLYSFFSASEERITKNLDVLKESSMTTTFTQNKVFEELSGFLNKYKGSSNKGKVGEEQLGLVLNNMYPNGEILNTSGTKASCDFMMKRFDKPTIFFETKEYDYNVPKDEIAKFIRDIDVQNANGVFLSHHSGISLKQNFQIDVNKGNILVYVHHCDYNEEKIKTAVDIIDSLSVKIKELNIDDENNCISKEILDDINEEYQTFISQKEMMMTILKDFQKKMTTQIEDFRMPVLDKYLEPKYASCVKAKCYTCELCNTFTSSNKQGLSAHKRGCVKKSKIPVLSPAFIPCVSENTIIIDTKTKKK